MDNNWIDNLDKVKEFISSNKKKPPKTTSIGSWLSDQLCYIRGNKGWAMKPEYAERKTLFMEFMDTYEEYLLTRDEIWDKKLKEVDEFMMVNNNVPTKTTNKSLSVWWLEQGSQSKNNKMPYNRIDKWNTLIEKHNKILNAEDDLWNVNLQKSINFIEANKKRPASSSKNSDEKIIGQWIVNQLQAKTLGVDKQKSWNEFLETYSEYFLSDDEMWNKRMEETKTFYDNNNKLPSHVSECAIEKTLGIWVQTQKKSLKLNNFINADRKTIWETFIKNVEKQINEKPIIKREITIKPKVERPVIEKTIVDKCSGKDRHGDCCRNYVINDTKYCKYHEYMVDFTDDDIVKLKLCKACQKWKLIEPDRQQCLSCYEIRKTYIAELREKEKSEIVLCKRDGCKNKKSETNDYCGLHQLQLFVDECKMEGLRPCVKYIKGCRAKLHPDYKRSSCETCLEKERKRDFERRNGVVSEVNNENNTKQCTTCCNVKSVSEFQPENTSGVLTKTCRQCRNSCKIQDAKRDKEHRNELAREAEKKPERIENKKEWKENNYEKVAVTWMNHRSKLIDENQEEYLKKQAENMKKWRQNNPEKVAEINKKRLENIKYCFTEYKNKTKRYDYDFELSLEQFEELVKQPCKYCNCIQDKGFNGIDRVDSMGGYTLNNVVSCCFICNRMKGALDNITFIKRIEHILSQNSYITPKTFHPELFIDQLGMNYNNYKNTNEKTRQYEFTLTENEYNKLINGVCYICGKLPSATHKNGIDRFDNDVGYVIENCNSCCGQCNYMKNDLEYGYFFDKLKNIYENSKSFEQKNAENTIINARQANIHKKDANKIKEQSRIRKEKQRERQREKYGDEEYKKMRAAEIAENRRKLKENNNNNV